MSTTKQPFKLRQRVPWFSIGGIFLLILFTLSNAAANMISTAVRPPSQEPEREDLSKTIADRSARVDALLREGDQCRPPFAHELARALVYDGRSAVAYADDYERRCGEDPIVRKWADVSLKFPRTLRR
ncbi:MAG: hypothetical protein ABI867_02105 [Kofleriaceae bacterium]